MKLIPVSVVIPTSGRFSLLERALDSLVHSTLVPREVIVVADSSLTDAKLYFDSLQAKYSASFEKLSFVQSSRRSGAAGTRNMGLSLVSNEFVAFLDDDDEFLPEKLSSQLEAMQKTGAVFSYSDYLRISKTSSNYADCKPKRKYKGDLAREIAFDDCRIATPTVLLRMSFIEKILPLFPEHMMTKEDNYAWLKVALKPGFTWIHINEALARVNLAESSLQRPLSVEQSRPSKRLSNDLSEILELASCHGLQAPVFHRQKVFLIRTLISIYRGFIPTKD